MYATNLELKGLTRKRSLRLDYCTRGTSWAKVWPLIRYELSQGLNFANLLSETEMHKMKNLYSLQCRDLLTTETGGLASTNDGH